MEYDQRDIDYMRLALSEAQASYNRGEIAIGAVLVIDDEVIGKGGNNQTSGGNWTDHAESILIEQYKSDIKKASQSSLEIELFSTLEPCLRCFGASVHTRINRIVYGSPDPAAGATNIQPPTHWYAKKWPQIKSGVLREECYDIFVKYMKESAETWKNILPWFEAMHRSW